MITAVVRRVRRNRICPHWDAIPEDGFRRQIPDFRPKAQMSLDGNGDAAETPSNDQNLWMTPVRVA